MKRLTDAQLICKAIVMGVARWEQFSSSVGCDYSGELCFGGIRYSPELRDNIPVMYPSMRADLESCVAEAEAKTTVLGASKGCSKAFRGKTE